MPANLLGNAKRRVTKIRSKSAGYVSAVFCDKCRPEVAGGVISGEAVEYIGVDVRVKLGDSRSNRS